MSHLSDTLKLLIAETEQLERYISSLESDLLKSTNENGVLEQSLKAAQEELTQAKNKITELEKYIEDSTTKPDPTELGPLPNVSITFLGVVSRPLSKGEFYSPSGETRWEWNPSSEVRIILDATEFQRRIIIERCWSDNLRLHKGQRVPFLYISGQSTVPVVDLPSMMKSGLVPNFNTDAKSLPNPELLSDITYGKSSSWKRWNQINSPGTYDPLSEEYGYVRSSWLGGAGPAINEASMLTPWDSAFLLSTMYPVMYPDYNPVRDLSVRDLYYSCIDTAETSGNYGIHYRDKDTVRSLRNTFTAESATAANLPQTAAENLPQLETASGLKLPKPDIAHLHALPNVAAMLTNDRFYVEELESWVLLGHLARKGKDRESGVYWSGQVRSAVWWLRSLYHLTRIKTLPEVNKYYTALLRKNLQWIVDTFTIKGASPEYRETGILSIVPISPSESVKYAAANAVHRVSTGNLYFMAHVAGEIMTHPDEEIRSLATIIVRHVTKAARGTFEHSQSVSMYLVPWLQHALVTSNDSWSTIIKTTFSNMTGDKVPVKFAPPITSDFVAWWRAAVVAAIDAGGDNQWAFEAYKWINSEIPKYKPLPLAWNIKPRTVKV
jgi:hypothetical protein